MDRRRHRWAQRENLVSCLVLGTVLAVLGGVLPESAARATDQGRATVSCPAQDVGFRPTKSRISRVVGPTRVLTRGHDRQGAPLPPPLTDRGKWQFAWDKSSTRPGGQHGVARLTAHTYPRDGSYGFALGNRLLSRLRIGSLITMSSSDNQRLCYRVVQRKQVKADRRLLAYYSLSGPPRLGILVCSGKRRGPGDWSHRTIWLAKPITGD